MENTESLLLSTITKANLKIKNFSKVLGKDGKPIGYNVEVETKIPPQLEKIKIRGTEIAEHKEIKIYRTEQWEWTAYGYGEEATGGSESDAELNLLRKVVKKNKK